MKRTNQMFSNLDKRQISYINLDDYFCENKYCYFFKKTGDKFFAKKFDDLSVLPTFVLAPLTYLGGIFYSVNLLPPFWKDLSHVNPILYMVNALRYSFIGVSDVNIYFSIGMMVVSIVVLFFICLICMHKSVGLRG